MIASLPFPKGHEGLLLLDLYVYWKEGKSHG